MGHGIPGQRRALALVLAGSALVPPGTTVAAAPQEVGVGPRSILIGQSAAFSGPTGDLGREFREGAHQVFERVNAEGGVHGRQIVMIYRDDGYDPSRSAANTRLFLQRDGVFALFGYVGTPTLKASLPQITAAGVPLVAPLTGAQLTRTSTLPLVFNIRASYHQEIEAIVSYLLRYGRRSIAIVYQNDAFGRDGLAGLQQALAARSLRPAAVFAIDRQLHDTSELARRIALVRPDAVLMVSWYRPVAQLVHQLRQRQVSAQVLTLSFVGSRALARTLPRNDRHGVGVSQVVPFPWNARVPIVRDYQNTIRRNNSGARFGFSSLEGFLAATVLVRALQAAGPDLTRARFIQALEAMGQTDLGGYTVHLGPGMHNGSDFVQLTFLVGRQGAFIH
mgnify:FL=1